VFLFSKTRKLSSKSKKSRKHDVPQKFAPVPSLTFARNAWKILNSPQSLYLLLQGMPGRFNTWFVLLLEILEKPWN